jgi:hypothetical protein
MPRSLPMLKDMPFLEKTAWTMSAVLIATGAFWAWEVVGAWIALGEAPPPSFKLAIVYVVFVIIGAAVTQGTLAATHPKEANAPADERERRVIDKAGNWSGYVLAFGAIAGILRYYVERDGDQLFQIVTASFMASQIAEYLFRIVLLRRGV